MSWKDKYDSVGYFYNGLARVGKKIDGKWKYGVVNTKGEEVVPCVYGDVVIFINGLAKVRKIIDGKWKYGFINTDCEEIVPCVYDFDSVYIALNDYKKKNVLNKFLEV